MTRIKARIFGGLLLVLCVRGFAADQGFFGSSSVAGVIEPTSSYRETAESGGAPASDSRVSPLAEVIVTARKREENAQTAPLSIAAITGENLEKNRVLTIEDLAQSIAGLSFTSSNPDSRELNIRGVDTVGLASPSADSSVAVFVDDVYVGRTNIMDFNFYDISRIEVVRGPQGVLLGKNVAGGAINIISNAPESEPSARVTTSLGNYDLRQVNAYATGAVAEGLTARASIQTIDHGGYSRDILHNTPL